MNTDKVKRLQHLDDEKRDLEVRLKEISEERKGLEQEVLDLFAEAGISSMKVDGRTVSLRRELWASPLDGQKDVACEYLKNNGLGVYVNETFNSLSISAYVRERVENDDLPAGFTDFFNVTEKYKIVTRK